MIAEALTVSRIDITVRGKVTGYRQAGWSYTDRQAANISVGDERNPKASADSVNSRKQPRRLSYVMPVVITEYLLHVRLLYANAPYDIQAPHEDHHPADDAGKHQRIRDPVCQDGRIPRVTNITVGAVA